MSKIGILAVDSDYANLALMKISGYHNAQGDDVEWYNQLCSFKLFVLELLIGIKIKYIQCNSPQKVDKT